MRSIPLGILVLCSVAVLTAGCVSENEAAVEPATSEDVEPNVSQVVGNLTASEFRNTTLVLEQPETGWSAVHMNLTPYGEGSVVVGVVLHPGDDATSYLLDGSYITDPRHRSPSLSGLSAIAFNATGSSTASVGAFTYCSLETDLPCSYVEKSLIVGSMRGAVSAEIGYVDPDLPHGEIAAELASKPHKRLHPEHTGDKGWAATHVRINSEEEMWECASDCGWTVGSIDVERQQKMSSPAGTIVDEKLRIEAQATMPVEGTSTAAAGEIAPAGTVNWSASLSIPPADVEEGGEWVYRPDPPYIPRVSPPSVPVGDYPSINQDLNTQTGEARFAYQRTFTGQTDPGPTSAGQVLNPYAELFTWGYFDSSFDEMYGWNWTGDQASGAGPSGGTPASAWTCFGPEEAPCLRSTAEPSVGLDP